MRGESIGLESGGGGGGGGADRTEEEEEIKTQLFFLQLVSS